MNTVNRNGARRKLLLALAACVFIVTAALLALRPRDDHFEELKSHIVEETRIVGRSSDFRFELAVPGHASKRPCLLRIITLRNVDRSQILGSLSNIVAEEEGWQPAGGHDKGSEVWFGYIQDREAFKGLDGHAIAVFGPPATEEDASRPAEWALIIEQTPLTEWDLFVLRLEGKKPMGSKTYRR